MYIARSRLRIFLSVRMTETGSTGRSLLVRVLGPWDLVTFSDLFMGLMYVLMNQERRCYTNQSPVR